MNGSRKPEMIEDFWIGMMIRVIRWIQGISWMMAASSISMGTLFMKPVNMNTARPAPKPR